MLNEHYPYYLANEAHLPNNDLRVIDKYTGELATTVAQADSVVLDQAIGTALQAEEAMASFPPYARKEALDHCVRRFEERREDLALALCIEAGKPIRDSRGEVGRLIDTFRMASEESVRLAGDVLNLEIGPRARGYRGFVRRYPVGACSFISPFNFPLNLAAHKIAPAIAAGCPFVLKPASRTPVGALMIGEILAEAELPHGAFSILPCRSSQASALVEDPRLKLLSFTGSAEVGWDLKRRAGKKRVVLELGGNAACVVDETWDDLDDALGRILFGAFYQSGQSCIAVQRILIHDSIYAAFKEKLVQEAQALEIGDPKSEDTFIGPLISESAAERIERWIVQAKERGATVLCGGKRRGVMMEATLLEGVPRELPAYRDEIFGPVAVLSRFSSFEAALDEVNDSNYGLQAGIFTRDLYRAQRAWDRLQVGGVVIGDVPSFRVDHMPYGGAKDSGMGREGIRYSIEDMTEPRLMVVRTPPSELRGP